MNGNSQKYLASPDSIPVSLLQKLLVESDLHKILDIITQFISQSLGSDTHGMILLFDPVRNCLHPGSQPRLHFTPENPSLENTLPVQATGTTSTRAAFYKTPILTLNADTDPGWSLNRGMARRLNLKSAYAFPILSSKNDLLGTLAVYYEHYLETEPAETALFHTLAGLAAVALEKHHEELRKKKMVSDLRASKERLKLAMQAQKMGVWDWFLDSNQLLWDENMFDVFGMDPKAFDGSFNSFSSCVYPEDMAPLQRVLDGVFNNDLPFDTQFRIVRRGEIRHIAAIGKLNRDDLGKPARMTGLNWDITDKVSATKKREQEKAKLVSNSKMASLGQMASGIAHEVNNPLTIILNRAVHLKDKILADRCEKNHAVAELEQVERTVARIAKIVRGLRVFSRNAENDPMVSYELNSIIEESLELCQERFKTNGISLKINGPSEILSIRCRPSQISQVLLNLLNNSFDAIIRTDGCWIEMDVSLSRETVQVRITDSGTGISDAVAEKMMDPFFTTKEVGKGTGLGLSISKGIIEDHGGRFYLDRKHPHTSFVISLPVEEVVRSNRSRAIDLASVH